MNLVLQFPMQHSHAIASWCMPALWMLLFAYLVQHFSDYDVGLVQLPIFHLMSGTPEVHRPNGVYKCVPT